MTIEEILEKKEYRIEASKYSFKFFLMCYFADNLNYPFADFHEDLFDDLEDDEILQILVVMFRESAKTFIVGIAYVLWRIVFRKSDYMVFCSDTSTSAASIMDNVKDHLQTNKILIHDFGQMYFEKRRANQKSVKKTEKRFIANGVCLWARGVEQKVRGVLHNGKRPDFALFDDVENVTNVNSVEVRAKTLKWINSEVLPALNKVNRKIIKLSNFLHEDCAAANIKKNKTWKTHWMPLYSGDILAWPDRWTFTKKEAVEWNHNHERDQWKISVEEEKERIGTNIFNMEYMLTPMKLGDVIIPEQWIKYYNNDFDWLNSNLFRIIITVDPAVKTGEANDFTAIAVVAQDLRSGLMYLIDIINRKLSFSEIKENISMLDRTYLPEVVLVEDVAAQNWLIQDLQNDNIPVQGVQRRADKRSRLISVSGHIENGRFLFRSNQRDAVSQLVGFTGTDKSYKDDMIDTIVDVIDFFTKKNIITMRKNKTGL